MKNIKKVYGFYKWFLNFQKWGVASNDFYIYHRIAKLPLVLRRKRGLQEKFNTLKQVHAMNIQKKLYTKDAYHWGLVNGMIYAISIMEGINAKYVKYIESIPNMALKPKKKSNLILPKSCK